MTKIFKAMPFGSARGERQNRVQSVECLDRALLIDTEYSGVHRRFEGQPGGIRGTFLATPSNSCPAPTPTGGGATQSTASPDYWRTTASHVPRHSLTATTGS